MNYATDFVQTDLEHAVFDPSIPVATGYWVAYLERTVNRPDVVRHALFNGHPWSFTCPWSVERAGVVLIKILEMRDVGRSSVNGYRVWVTDGDDTCYEKDFALDELAAAHLLFNVIVEASRSGWVTCDDLRSLGMAHG